MRASLPDLIQQLDTLVSEGRNPQTMDLDTLSTQSLLTVINNEDRKVADAVNQALPEITLAVDHIVASMNKGGRLIYIGAGTSGRLGVLDAVECRPTFSVSEDLVVGIIAGGERALIHAVEGAEDDSQAGINDLTAISLQANDVVVGIAASGRTPYVIGALEYANELGCETICLVCNPDAPLLSVAKTGICVTVGPECLTGSTRMKSGTAQKLVLNMLSTASMVKLGKVYQNLMVDLNASNKKLVARAIRIVMQATNCKQEQAERALIQADNSAKLAILMILTNADAEQAMAMLDSADGFYEVLLMRNSVMRIQNLMNITTGVRKTSFMRIIIALSCLVLSCTSFSSPNQTGLVLGAERLTQYLPLLADKRVGLVVNQTSKVRDMHLLDILLENDVQVKVLFAPEHGVRGNVGAGEHIDSGVDTATGVPIQSIYGKYKTPPDELMQTLDVIIFDIQDVGTRFYTYISSMHYMMAAAAQHKVHFIVLDRPNPNGMYVDGPILDLAFQSFVGMHPIPVLHGLTVGELALMIKGERWIDNASKLALTIIPMQGYHKSMGYSLPVPPSPNLPNDIAIELYPSLCFFEATAISVGRGTDQPFQQIGHHEVKLGQHTFTPESRPYSAPTPKLEGKKVYGIDMRNSGVKGLSLAPLMNAYNHFKTPNFVEGTFFTSADFMDKLAGTDQLRLAIQSGKTEQEIRQSWQQGLLDYKQRRSPYLIYPLDD